MTKKDIIETLNNYNLDKDKKLLLKLEKELNKRL